MGELTKIGLARLDGAAARYCQLRDIIKTDSSEQKNLSEELKGAVEISGNVYDEKGSKCIETAEYRICREIRETMVPTEDALEVLKSISIDVLKQCAPRVVDSKLVATAFEQGLISDKLLKKILTKKQTAAISVIPLSELRTDGKEAK